MSQVTEAHLKLADKIVHGIIPDGRDELGTVISYRGLNVEEAAQLIAESEANAVEAMRIAGCNAVARSEEAGIVALKNAMDAWHADFKMLTARLSAQKSASAQ